MVVAVAFALSEVVGVEVVSVSVVDLLDLEASSDSVPSPVE